LVVVFFWCDFFVKSKIFHPHKKKVVQSSNNPHTHIYIYIYIFPYEKYIDIYFKSFFFNEKPITAVKNNYNLLLSLFVSAPGNTGCQCSQQPPKTKLEKKKFLNVMNPGPVTKPEASRGSTPTQRVPCAL
jgi:hypothetical protein